ncbi:hypothetical protein Val02_85760 [Virgisporangium aliadipatigenens]|uniref:DUF4012 domain-containing protein n=1 Tax=Virgisporangium aliadipatigenens TaxID=741659 RepID=A0A8J3YXP3_9ACTN|nr:DUF4012 domain-containing protein [Virgisporangium aliadipatigenens]GIJ51690.1 hypothetical protein Val02_85760 [Virgisporangium aliadipatigenens]
MIDRLDDAIDAEGGGGAPESRPHRERRRRRLRSVALLLVGLLLLAGTPVLWLAVQVRDTRTHLLAAAQLVPALQLQLQTGDAAQARNTLNELRRHTNAARAGADDPTWRLAGRFPWVGHDASTVRTIAATLDDLADDGLAALLEAAGELRPETLLAGDGRIDVDRLRAAAPHVARADAAVRRARDRVVTLDPAGLRPQVRDAVTRLRDGLDKAAGITAAAVTLTGLLPGMLGADGPRTYLAMFQNPAEVRATGGMPGSFVVLRADAGRMELTSQGSTAVVLPPFEAPVVPVAPNMRALYSDKLAVYPANVNLTPYFPYAANTLREMFRLRTGTTVDGVLVTDPVVLGYLLRATGPVEVPGGPALTADTAVRTLLSDAYRVFGDDDDAQNRYFGAAARAAFTALAGGAASPAALVAALRQATAERRILIWSARPEEQSLIAGTALEGALPPRDGDRPTIGLFLNDGSGAKLGYYLRQRAEVGYECRPDRRMRLTLFFELSSEAPTSGLPASVLGLGLAGNPYTARTIVSAFSPTGGALESVTLDGQPIRVSSGTEQNRMVGRMLVDVPAGGARALEITLLTAPLPEAARWRTPTLRLTPTVEKAAVNVKNTDKCASA